MFRLKKYTGEKICPRCGSKNIVPSYNKWKKSIMNALAENRGLRSGHGMATALDSRYLCQSCGYVGHVVEKDAEKVERYVGRDLKKIKKDLRKP